MAEGRKAPVCEIIFGQLRIPVWNPERGKRVIEGIFLIGESGEGKARERRKLGRRVGKKPQVRAGARRSDKARRMKTIAMLMEKGLKASQIAKKVGVSAMTVSRDLKAMKKVA